MQGRENFIRFWDKILGSSSDTEAAQHPVVSPQGTPVVEARGSPDRQNLSLGGNLTSEGLKGASEPVSSDLAVSSESSEVVGAVQLPDAIREVVSDSAGGVVTASGEPKPHGPKSLQSLVQKYCVYEGYIELDRISPGNNPRVVKECSVDIIKNSILNSGWDDSSVFIICVVTDDNNLTNPDKVRSDPELLAFVIEHCTFVFVNGHHRDLALKVLKKAEFTKFPLPSKVKCQLCVGISDWDHFLISKKANFVSCAAAPDTIFDKITAVDRAIEQFTIMFPKQKQTETKIKNFFEEEVGEKTISTASFNLYYNLSKVFSKETKAVLKHDTLLSSGEFLTTDAMKHIVQETKKNLRLCLSGTTVPHCMHQHNVQVLLVQRYSYVEHFLSGDISLH